MRWEGNVPDEALKQARHGPLAVLLLLCGLVFGSAFGPGAGIGEGPGSRLSESRPAKGFVALRTAARDLAAEDEDERSDGPVLPPEPAVVTQTVAVRPGLPFAAAVTADRSRLPFPAYRARAPPAA